MLFRLSRTSPVQQTQYPQWRKRQINIKRETADTNHKVATDSILINVIDSYFRRGIVQKACKSSHSPTFLQDHLPRSSTPYTLKSAV